MTQQEMVQTMQQLQQLLEKHAASLDPNWFYSSVSQSAAALIGLLGAILATRVQQQYEETRSSYREVGGKVEYLVSLVRSRLDELQSFINFAEVRIPEIETALRSGQQRLHVVGIDKMMLGGDGWGSREINISQSLVTSYNDAVTLARSMQKLLEEYKNCQSVKHALRLATDIAAFRKMLSRVPALLPEYHLSENDMNQFAHYFEVALDEIQKSYSVHVGRTASVRVPAVLTIMLGWLSVFGLLLPLGFLSAYGDMSKTWLLIAFGLGVTGIPLFIGWEVVRIWRMQNVRIPTS